MARPLPPPPPPKRPDFNPGQEMRPGMIVHDFDAMVQPIFPLARCAYCGRHGYEGKSCEGCGAQVSTDWPVDAFIWDYNPSPKPEPKPEPGIDWFWLFLAGWAIGSTLYAWITGGL